MKGYFVTGPYPARIDIQNCELTDFHIIDPPVSVSHSSLSDLYKRLRIAYQQKGDRREVASYFYKERYHEFLSNLRPFIPLTIDLPRRAYIGSYRDMYERWRLKQYSTSSVLKMLRGNAVFYIKLFFLPHYLARFLWKKTTVISEGFDWLAWGFGERPGRIFLWMAGVIGIFAAQYSFSEKSPLKGAFVDSLFCSIFNFTTAGCDQHKLSYDSIEGLLGATLVGIMVAGFANRTRY